MPSRRPLAKPSFAAKLIWGFIIIFFSINAGIWFTGYTYIYKTLLYTYPDIDDLGIFETRTVQSVAPQKWSEGRDYNTMNLPAATTAELVKEESVAFLVIKNDSVRYEQYWDHSDPNTLSNSFSVAKSIVGLLCGIAIGEGKLSMEDPVGKYLPHFNEGENKKLTVRHLLEMASGLDWDESYSSLFSRTTEAYYGSNLPKLVNTLQVIEEPGKTFRYMSCNTLILGMVLEKATGKKLSDYAAEKLWDPIGAENPAYWSLDRRDGTEKAYCCFYADARDFARIGQLVLDSGSWKGKQIVPRDYLNTSFSLQGLKDPKGRDVDYYGLQWWLIRYKDHSVMYAQGIYGQYIIVIPDLHIVAVRLGKKRGDKLASGRYSDLMLYLDGILETWK